MIFRQLFDSVSSTYSYVLASRRGGEAYRKLLQELLVLQAAHEASGDARAEDAA